MASFYDRSSDAGAGAFYDRTNDADLGSAQAFGGFATAVLVSVGAGASGYSTVSLAEPFDYGIGSIFWPLRWTGSDPETGDTVRFPTDDGFRILLDGTIQSSVNTGTYECWYDDGTGEVQFDVTLDDHADAIGAMPGAFRETFEGSAWGGTAGNASGDLAEASSGVTEGEASNAVVADGVISVASTLAPAGVAESASFPGNALGSIAIATAFTARGTASGAAEVFAGVGVATAEAFDGIGNETGRGDAIGGFPGARALSLDGNGRVMWGRVPKNNTIWTVVS